MTVKINIGSGPVGKDDWINVDYGILTFFHRFALLEKLMYTFRMWPKGWDFPYPKNLVFHDCRKKLPFPDNYADYIYSSHFIEHVKRYEAIDLLKECYRVLKPGGTIRVVVPDLEILCKKYLEKDYEFFGRMSVFLDSTIKKPLKEVVLADWFTEYFYLYTHRIKPKTFKERVVNYFTRPHKWMYDADSLEVILKQTGFIDIIKKECKVGNLPDLDFLDKFPEQSLHTEAVKPKQCW